MQEKNICQCKICKEMKLRIQDGKFGDNLSKKWRDENGKMWNGKCCNSCHVIIQREMQRVRRGMKK